MKDQQKCEQRPTTVHVGWVVAVLGMDEVLEIVLGNDSLMRYHQELVTEARAMIIPSGPHGVDTRVSNEMQQRFDFFVMIVNEAILKRGSASVTLPFQIPAFPYVK